MYERYQVIQDMLVPLNDLGESLEFFDQELKVSLVLTVFLTWLLLDDLFFLT